jgi:addiction module RelB/DinJ family antitoxin
MDENLKRDFETACGDMGLTMTTAFTLFAKTVSLRREIPFKVTAERPARNITLANGNALTGNRPLSEEDEEWGNLPGERLTVAEAAGKWREWADPALIDAEYGSAWADAAAENEIRKREDVKKYGIVGR